MNSHGKQVYPEDLSCIIDPVEGRGGLYIGNLQAAQNLNTLRKLQVRALLTAAKGIEIAHPKQEVPYFLYVPAEDHQSFDISKYFHQAAGYINECLQRTNILVHCLAGVSRSVSLVLAFLMKHKGLAYNQAYDAVKTRRKIIHPNDGFIEQLRKFERSLPPSLKEVTHSLSPQKTHLRREFSMSGSPTKQNKINIQSILSRYQPYANRIVPTALRNPESQYQIRRQPFSPQKANNRLKRFSSINVEANNLNDGQSQVANRSRLQANYRPFGNGVENRIEVGGDYSDIDKRIEQIRRKYQDYTPSVGSASKYSNYVSGGEENVYRGRTNSYADYKNNKDNGHYRLERRETSGQFQPSLKRLTSFQEY